MLKINNAFEFKELRLQMVSFNLIFANERF